MSKINKEKVQKIRVLEDLAGKYIPYCNYHVHPGIPHDERICERRQCQYYFKFRPYTTK